MGFCLHLDIIHQLCRSDTFEDHRKVDVNLLRESGCKLTGVPGSKFTPVKGLD